jgi:hypothetical protein
MRPNRSNNPDALKSVVSVILIALFAVPQVALAESDSSRSILTVQDWVFHGGEAPLNPGAGWLALLREGKEWRLKPATLTGQTARDEIVDGDRGQPSGVRITADPPTALAYIRHPHLRAGQIPSVQVTAAVAEDEVPRLFIPIDGPEQRLLYLGTSYRVSATTLVKSTPEAMGRYTLTATVGNRSPITLADEEFRDEDAVSIVWAGDMNHDGFLDLITQTSWHNGEFMCWYLSSNAPRFSYKKMGCHHVSGC